jgi:DNA-binding LacI/PurR family transcriptional regulator
MKESRITAVVCDHRTGIHSATAHLIRLGHHRIAFCCGPLNIRATRERVAGFEQAHRDAGIAVNPAALRIARGHTEEHGAEVTESLLNEHPRPTALLCAGLQLTIGAIVTLKRRGLELGDDMSFVTCDQASFLELIYPPVSRIERDRELIGATAASLLLSMLESDRVPRRRMVPTTYVPQATSRAPGVTRQVKS